MQPLIGRCLQQIQQKAAGCRRLTASESDPALRVQIVKPVLQNYAHDIIHGHEPAAHLSGFRGTDFRASAAVPTLCTVKRRNSPSHDCGPGRTDLLARTAAGAEKSGIPDCCTRGSAADSLSGKPSSVCPVHPSLTSAGYCKPFPDSLPPPSFSAVPLIRPYTGTGGRRTFRCRQFRYFSMPQAPYYSYQTYSVRLMISFCTPRSRRVKYALKPATRTTRSLYSSG